MLRILMIVGLRPRDILVCLAALLFYWSLFCNLIVDVIIDVRLWYRACKWR